MGGKQTMAKIDDVIADVAYILDCLRAYRSIVNSGDCNNCRNQKRCDFSPEIGTLVRYNCPFYKRRSNGKDGVER